MPGQDQTGPAGNGPGTGRGMGPCGRGMAYGRGFGRGFGRGRGFGAGFYGNYVEPEPLSKEAQKQLLEAELKRIEAEKTQITKRLTTLE
ncbi:MAG TPA: DUF5320 domain-containing protein [Methanoregula sp.]|nr:DUF5320 domain-containing protein [Methanoregula sp.]